MQCMLIDHHFNCSLQVFHLITNEKLTTKQQNITAAVKILLKLNDYELMWIKLEGAVSPECNEVVASKKFKERVQKPGQTITAFITDLMLFV